MEWISASERLPEMKPRDKKDGTRLISNWVQVELPDGKIESAYFHFLHGWMRR